MTEREFDKIRRRYRIMGGIAGAAVPVGVGYVAYRGVSGILRKKRKERERERRRAEERRRRVVAAKAALAAGLVTPPVLLTAALIKSYNTREREREREREGQIPSSLSMG